MWTEPFVIIFLDAQLQAMAEKMVKGTTDHTDEIVSAPCWLSPTNTNPTTDVAYKAGMNADDDIIV